jgi:hypothetical protein
MVLGNRDHCNFYSGFTLLPSVWRAALQLAPFLNGQHFEYHIAQPAVRCGRSAPSEEQAVWGGAGSGITTLGAKVQAS